MCILAIESSCDDTSAAIIDPNGRILANIMATQTVHEQYGGVLPEAASRAHQINIVPVVEAAFRKANISKNQISAVAFTRGPGLMGSLLVGVSFAKAFALAHQLPLIEVHHIQAHVLAHFIPERKPKFPFLCLTVSGGHTQIMLIRDYLDMEILGATIDDAAGEAFDKSGKLLGLPYPAGAVMDKLAKQGKPIFEFSEPKIEGYNFSFSGLKTQILRFLQKEQQADPNFIQANLPDLCASIQSRIVSILMNKLVACAAEYGIKEVGIAGGVSANSGLRSALQEAAERYGWQTYIPEFQYCTDNAGMIAIAAHYKQKMGLYTDQTVVPQARYEL